MNARKIGGSVLMAASVALVAGTYGLADHRTRTVVVLTKGDLVFYPLFAVAMATFMAAWIGGWMWEGVLGDKRKSLVGIFTIVFGAFLLLGLGSIILASAFGKGELWVENLRGWPVIALLAWQTAKAARDGKSQTKIGRS